MTDWKRGAEGGLKRLFLLEPGEPPPSALKASSEFRIDVQAAGPLDRSGKTPERKPPRPAEPPAIQPPPPQAVVPPRIPATPPEPANAAVAAAPPPDALFAIRQSLYPLIVFFTTVYFFVMLRDFLRGHAGIPIPMISEMYSALLGAYSGDREARHWAGQEDRYAVEVEFLIYFWWLFYGAAVALSATGRGYSMPPDLPRLCLEILVVFFGTRASKHWRAAGASRDNPRSEVGDLEARILDYARSAGRVTTQDCVARLGISERHARRFLSSLADAGRLIREGDARSTTFRIP